MVNFMIKMIFSIRMLKKYVQTTMIGFFLFVCLPAWGSLSEKNEEGALSSKADSISASYSEFSSNSGYHFKNSRLLDLAVTHNSDDLGVTSALRGNERLEFLGDSVLEFGLRVTLWKKAPVSFRGDLPTVIASLAENATLSKICDHIGLDKLTSFPPFIGSIYKEC